LLSLDDLTNVKNWNDFCPPGVFVNSNVSLSSQQDEQKSVKERHVQAYAHVQFIK